MYPKILQRCLEELNKTDVDLSYIRGMIETLLVMNPILETTATLHKDDDALRVVPITTNEHGIPPVPPLAIVKDLAAKSLNR